MLTLIGQLVEFCKENVGQIQDYSGDKNRSYQDLVGSQYGSESQYAPTR